MTKCLLIQMKKKAAISLAVTVANGATSGVSKNNP